MRYLLISALAFSGLLAACTEEEKGPMPGTAEAIMQSRWADWKANEKRSFVFDAEEWSLDDTTDYTCESRNGVVGTCVRVHRCCGAPPEADTVDGYTSPTELFARLRTDVARLKYDFGESSGDSFKVIRHGTDGKEIAAGISVAFHRDLGYPISVAWFGESPDSGISITRLVFR